MLITGEASKMSVSAWHWSASVTPLSRDLSSPVTCHPHPVIFSPLFSLPSCLSMSASPEARRRLSLTSQSEASMDWCDQWEGSWGLMSVASRDVTKTFLYQANHWSQTNSNLVKTIYKTSTNEEPGRLFKVYIDWWMLNINGKYRFHNLYFWLRQELKKC